MQDPSRLKFEQEIIQLRIQRDYLLSEYTAIAAEQRKTPITQYPLDWGLAGDLQRDIELLQQLLRLEK